MPPPTLGPDGQFRIVAVMSAYLPTHRRGAQLSTHDALARFVTLGNEVTVVCTRDAVPGELDGVRIVDHDEVKTRGLVRGAHLVATQLNARPHAARLAAAERRPLVFFSRVGDVSRAKLAGRAALTVFASRGLAEEQRWLRPGVVVDGRIDQARYLTTPGECLTLVNLLDGKGAGVFFELARRLPDRRFLGVRTSGPQDIPNVVPDNVELVGPVDDMREVYSRTRVLLAPSQREALGRVPVEAAVSGIPTIAHPNSGTREALGDAAIWVTRDDLDGWVRAIESLDDPVAYAQLGAAARERARPCASFDAIDGLERRLRAIARAHAW
ncbi:MAG: glycosyltransferase [Acidimicrobiia bacterium]